MGSEMCIRDRDCSNIGGSITGLDNQQINMPEPIDEEPAGIGNDRGNQIVTTSLPEATQPKVANGEMANATSFWNGRLGQPICSAMNWPNDICIANPYSPRRPMTQKAIQSRVASDQRLTFQLRRTCRAPHSKAINAVQRSIWPKIKRTK